LAGVGRRTPGPPRRVVVRLRHGPFIGPLLSGRCARGQTGTMGMVRPPTRSSGT
jgi:hypothetical protein